MLCGGDGRHVPLGKKPGPGSPHTAAQAVHCTNLGVPVIETMNGTDISWCVSRDGKVQHTQPASLSSSVEMECFRPTPLLQAVSAGQGWVGLAGVKCQGTLHKPQSGSVSRTLCKQQGGGQGGEGSSQLRHSSLLLSSESSSRASVISDLGKQKPFHLFWLEAHE